MLKVSKVTKKVSNVLVINIFTGILLISCIVMLEKVDASLDLFTDIEFHGRFV